MAKLSLTPPPTFDTPVPIPVPNGTVDVLVTFKRRKRDELQAFSADLAAMTDEQAVVAVAQGWNLDDEFNEANVKRLCDTYVGAGRAIVQTYLQQSTGARHLI